MDASPYYYAYTRDYQAVPSIRRPLFPFGGRTLRLLGRHLEHSVSQYRHLDAVVQLDGLHSSV